MFANTLLIIKMYKNIKFKKMYHRFFNIRDYIWKIIFEVAFLVFHKSAIEIITSLENKSLFLIV